MGRGGRVEGRGGRGGIGSGEEVAGMSGSGGKEVCLFYLTGFLVKRRWDCL